MKSNILILLLVIMIAVASIPAAILLFIGLVPTLAAKFSDTRSNGSIPKTVAFFNMAGIVPYMMDLIPIGQDMDAGMKVVSDSLTWLIIYGYAGIGWLVVFTVPVVVKAIQRKIIQRRLVIVDKQQEALKEEWSNSVMKL